MPPHWRGRARGSGAVNSLKVNHKGVSCTQVTRYTQRLFLVLRAVRVRLGAENRDVRAICRTRAVSCLYLCLVAVGRTCLLRSMALASRIHSAHLPPDDRISRFVWCEAVPKAQAALAFTKARLWREGASHQATPCFASRQATPRHALLLLVPCDSMEDRVT